MQYFTFCRVSFVLAALACSSAACSDDDGDAGSGSGQPCTPGGELTCPPMEFCSGQGRCTPIGDDAGQLDGDADAGDDGSRPPRDGASSDGAGGDADACASVEANFQRIIPTVHVVIDQSSSMDVILSGGLSRWEALKTALMDETTGLIPRMQSDVRFGAAFYSWQRSDGVDACPELTTIAPALENESAIRSVYDALELSQATPTGATIRALTDEVGTVAPDEPVIFILATDGLPDRCIAMNIPNDPLAKQEVVDEVARAYDRGIRTFYIDVGGSIADEQHKQDVANAGVGGSGGTYSDVTSTSQLVGALEEIVRGEVSCDLELEGEITDLARACEGTVLLNGSPLPCDDVDGWNVVDETTVRLQGAACEAIREGGATVSASFPCGIVVI